MNKIPPIVNNPTAEALKDLEAIQRLLWQTKIQIDALPESVHTIPSALLASAIERASDLFDYISIELDHVA